MRTSLYDLAHWAAWLGVAACVPESPVATAPDRPSFAAAVKTRSSFVVDVSRDTTAQNETPVAVNPLNSSNILTGANDWNYNDGGLTWQDGVHAKPVQVSTWTGNGKAKGSEGQFPDHESIAVDLNPGSPFYGSVYVTWVQFNGLGGHS